MSVKSKACKKRAVLWPNALLSLQCIITLIGALCQRLNMAKNGYWHFCSFESTENKLVFSLCRSVVLLVGKEMPRLLDVDLLHN